MVKSDSLDKKVSNKEENGLDDTNDHIYTAGGEKIYAIIRQEYCRSNFFVKMVNEFGALGGFQMIIDRIQDTNNWAPIEIVTLYLTIIGNISNLLHREFAHEYIPGLRRAVWKNLLQSPDSNIRNFTKEKLDDIISAFETLLKRVYQYDEIYEVLLIFSL